MDSHTDPATHVQLMGVKLIAPAGWMSGIEPVHGLAEWHGASPAGQVRLTNPSPFPPHDGCKAGSTCLSCSGTALHVSWTIWPRCCVWCSPGPARVGATCSLDPGSFACGQSSICVNSKSGGQQQEPDDRDMWAKSSPWDISLTPQLELI